MIIPYYLCGEIILKMNIKYWLRVFVYGVLALIVSAFFILMFILVMLLAMSYNLWWLLSAIIIIPCVFIMGQYIDLLVRKYKLEEELKKYENG